MKNLEKLANDPEAMEIIASKESSMRAFMYNAEAFAALINSEIAMGKVAASETAVNAIIRAITDTANAETVLTGIKERLTGIEESLPSIPDSENATQVVAETGKKISCALSAIKKITSKTDNLVNNINFLLTSEEKMTALLSNETVFVSLLSNPDVVNAIYATDERKKTFLMVIKDSTVKGHIDARAQDYKTADGSNYSYDGKIIALDLYRSGSCAGWPMTVYTNLYTSYCIANGNLKSPCNPLEAAYAIFSNVQPTNVNVYLNGSSNSCQLSGYRAVRLPLENN